MSRRRLFIVMLVPVALLVLAFIGRHASTDALAAPTSSDADVPDDSSSETAASSSASSSPSEVALAIDASPPAVEVQPDGAVLVDLNHATEDELRKLPGVGPQKARAIMELRARLGGFKKVEDLSRTKGFGRSTIRRLRPFVRITPK